MTATDELRRMLDERGVEHGDVERAPYPPYNSTRRMTTFRANKCVWQYIEDEREGGDIQLVGRYMSTSVTPEQAIAATVGANDGQTIGRHPQPKERWTTALLSDLAWPDDGSWPDYLSVARNRESAEGGEWRVYVPEDATVGAGTCGVEVIDTGNEAAYEHYEHIMHCKHCNHEYGYVQYDEDGDTWMDEPPNFCPNCGAKALSE